MIYGVWNRLFLLFMVFTLSVTAAFAAGRGEAIDPVTLEGEVVYLLGDVRLNSETVDIGDAVLPGDRIVTGSDGIVEITFGPRNILQFREETNAVIEAAWSGVELESGTLSAVLNGLARLGFGDQKRFQVHTATAAMGVRGTAFFIVHPDLNQAYFCTCNGKLHLEAPGGEAAQDTEAYHHAGVWYVRTPGGIEALPSGLHYHDDDTLNTIARRAGTTVRWRD